MINALLLAALLCPRAHAAASRTAPELLAHPELPVYPSPFYAHPDYPQLLPAPLGRDPIVQGVSAPLPEAAREPLKPAAPLLPATAVPPAAEVFAPAMTNMTARKALSPEERGAVAAVARQAFDAKDVDTLAQLALLTGNESNRATHDLLMEALHILRHRILTRESVEAERALQTVGTRAALPDETRQWIAEQVGGRAAKRYLAGPAQ